MPERRAGRDVVEMEEIELDTEAAMVAAARLLELVQVRVEILLRVERGAVDAGQLLVRGIAAPVRAGETGELERLDRLRVLQMRTAAEIGEVTLRVERDVALGRVDELDLERLVLGREPRLRVVARDLLARPLASFLDLALHLGFDRLEVLFANRLREEEVVVEAVLDRRADRDLHAGMQTAHRLGEEVRARVAQDVERIGILRVARRQELDRLAVAQRQPQIVNSTVRAHEDRLLGELRPDRARGVETRRAVGKFKLGVVGQYDFHERRQGYAPPRR